MVKENKIFFNGGMEKDVFLLPRVHFKILFAEKEGHVDQDEEGGHLDQRPSATFLSFPPEWRPFASPRLSSFFNKINAKTEWLLKNQLTFQYIYLKIVLWTRFYSC
jgi:hypothetical protein